MKRKIRRAQNASNRKFHRKKEEMVDAYAGMFMSMLPKKPRKVDVALKPSEFE